MDLRQGELGKDFPKDVRVISLVHGREEISDHRTQLFFRLSLRNMKLKSYCHFSGLLKRKVRAAPDIEGFHYTFFPAINSACMADASVSSAGSFSDKTCLQILTTPVKQ
ncbi:hypothetical protein [Chryseobacterium hagamense]|uniref:hypothetical protein n=1 Tax=Chryseobacterium hagamense TaxID=395935 RepID=UPI0011BF7CA1|nr:hypothetical protein [Chryseobacterium hagamense]